MVAVNSLREQPFVELTLQERESIHPPSVERYITEALFLNNEQQQRWKFLQCGALENTILDTNHYKQWALAIYKIAIPILTRFLPTDLEREHIEHRCVCPILQDWMTDPVVTNDGYHYERDVIEAYIHNRLRSQLPISSPFQVVDIDPGSVKSNPNYYREMFEELMRNYSIRQAEHAELKPQRALRLVLNFKE